MEILWRSADQGAAAPRLDRGQATVGSDLVQPRPHRLPAVEAPDRFPGPQQRLLHHIVRVMHRTEHSITVPVQLVPVRFDQSRERPLVTRTRGGQQLPRLSR
jgi:hypothetical protein